MSTETWIIIGTVVVMAILLELRINRIGKALDHMSSLLMSVPQVRAEAIENAKADRIIHDQMRGKDHRSAPND